MMTAMAGDLLSVRALNRATLERQLLLRRSTMPVTEAVEHLVGMQAQVPHNPYLGLWSRLDGFRPADLGRLLLDRRLVRIVVMRATIHLVTDRDALELRPIIQPVLDQELRRHPDHAPTLVDVDLDDVLRSARPILAEPRTIPQLRTLLAERYPEHDPAALAYACRCLLPLVQVPPRGVWGRTSQVTLATAESWLGRPLSATPSIETLVLRYLGAFGPASPADVTTWCRLAGMREVMERLRPRLRVFRDDAGRELFDLPDAPRPDPDVKAPPRFLPEYDNVLLSHADRSRFVDAEGARPLFGRAAVHGTALVDGRLHATWRIERDRATNAATLVVTHTTGMPKRAQQTLGAEGRRLLGLLAADASSHVVRMLV
jgi:Winged helix DNA-binding domain